MAYVSASQADRRARSTQERISHEAFVYEREADVYRCPADRVLRPTDGRKINTGGRVEIRYISRKADCDACAMRARCLSAKTPTRTIARWEHEDVLERHRERMKDARTQMRRRAELAEHPLPGLSNAAGQVPALPGPRL